MLVKLFISNVVPILQGLYVPWRLFIEKNQFLWDSRKNARKRDFRITIKIAVDEEVFSITVYNSYIQRTASHGPPATQSRRTFVVSSSARTKDIKRKI